MKRKWFRIFVGMALILLAGSGCGSDSSEEDTDYSPAVDVNGTWDVRLDGDPLGTMVLSVTDGGKLTGTLTTLQDAVADLDGYMDDYLAEFTVTFPAEAYLGILTFAEQAVSASGALWDNQGVERILSMTPRFGD